MSRYFNPRTETPQNGTQERVRQTHDRLVEAGHEDQAAKLRRDDGDTMKARMARQLEAKLLTPPSITQQITTALEDADDLSEDDRETVEQRLGRAHTLESSNPERAETLRERALALAKHGPPQSHAGDLPSAERDSAEDLLARAETMAGIDPGVSTDLRERAVDIITETVRGERDDVESFVIDRDVEATVTDLTDQGLENEDTPPGQDPEGEEASDRIGRSSDVETAIEHWKQHRDEGDSTEVR